MTTGEREEQEPQVEEGRFQVVLIGVRGGEAKKNARGILRLCLDSYLLWDAFGGVRFAEEGCDSLRTKITMSGEIPGQVYEHLKRTVRSFQEMGFAVSFDNVDFPPFSSGD